ncbi:hypothetical protein [Actinocatenispora thailandica]|uniref:hypothetical protein n=1 Tax=Actinocatenispora thailandica TaxID=227318 RepID=UPI00194EC935|nr:hypothetical protein [Actinocatenispora thailandica]
MKRAQADRVVTKSDSTVTPVSSQTMRRGSDAHDGNRFIARRTGNRYPSPSMTRATSTATPATKAVRSRAAKHNTSANTRTQGR